ncbi:MAG: ribonuclease H family protein [Lachnospiraceae bacterium]|nr:ribonuclease H family protein [Lachnospiraceae bacterium]
MVGKFYAVRKGKKTGIFSTWEECKRQVDGFSGAEYKSFKTKAEAQEYCESTVKVEGIKCEAECYTDGSFDVDTNRYSYGALILWQGQEYELSEAFYDEEMASMRNVAGEIEGARAAMKFCVEHGIKSLLLHYDYEGVEKWCISAWKCNKKGTIAYKAYYDEIKQDLQVVFHHVKGHSGVEGNERVDGLAKKALGIG